MALRIGGRTLVALVTAGLLSGGCTRSAERTPGSPRGGQGPAPRVHVAFRQQLSLAGYDNDRVFYTSRAPGSETFAAPVPLTDRGGATSLVMAVSPDDTAHLAYFLMDDQAASLIYRRGAWTSGALRLSEPVTVAVERSPPGKGRSDPGAEGIRLVLDPAGNPQIGFMLRSGQESSCQLARSRDQGATFSRAVVLAAPCARFELAAAQDGASVVLDGCPPGKTDGCGLLYRGPARAELVPLAVPNEDPTYDLELSRSGQELGVVLTTGQLPHPCGSRLAPPCVADAFRTQVWHSSDGGATFAGPVQVEAPQSDGLVHVDARGGLHLLSEQRHRLRSRLAHAYLPFGATSAAPRFLDEGCRLPSFLSGSNPGNASLVLGANGTVHAGLMVGGDAIAYAWGGDGFRCEDAAQSEAPANLDLAVDGRGEPHLIWRVPDPDRHDVQSRLLYVTRDPRTGRFGSPVQISLGGEAGEVYYGTVRVAR